MTGDLSTAGILGPDAAEERLASCVNCAFSFSMLGSRGRFMGGGRWHLDTIKSRRLSNVNPQAEKGAHSSRAQLGLTRGRGRVTPCAASQAISASPIPMLSLLLSSAGFHVPSAGTLKHVAPSRSHVLVAQMSEEDAKAAWLARSAPPEPAWQSGNVVSTTASQPAMAQVPNDGWIVQGAPVLTLEAADEMSNIALRECYANQFAPVSVCVMDASGRVIVAKSMIHSSRLSADFAHAKASVCIGMHCSSRELKDKYVDDSGGGPKMPQALAMCIAGAAANQPLATFPGGVLLRDSAHNLLGAIGVSGAASDEDEHCAITGAHSIGLVTEPAVSRLA